MRQKGVDNDSI